MHLTSRDAWETLAAFVREGAERLVQQLLEEEVAERLAERRHAGPGAGDAPVGCRSGHGRPRRLRTVAGDLHVRRPRLRGFQEGFRSEVLPSFVRCSRQAGQLQMELYLEGLASADFDRALAGLLGGPPSLSESATARLRRAWLKEHQAWRCAPLGRLEPRYVLIDRLAAADTPAAARTTLLVAIASLTDGASRVLAVEPSTQSASVLLRRLKERGLSEARLVVGGGELSPPRRAASSPIRAPR